MSVCWKEAGGRAVEVDCFLTTVFLGKPVGKRIFSLKLISITLNLLFL